MSVSPHKNIIIICCTMLPVMYVVSDMYLLSLCIRCDLNHMWPTSQCPIMSELSVWQAWQDRVKYGVQVHRDMASATRSPSRHADSVRLDKVVRVCYTSTTSPPKGERPANRVGTIATWQVNIGYARLDTRRSGSPVVSLPLPIDTWHALDTMVSYRLATD